MKIISLTLSAALAMAMTACAQNNGHTQAMSYTASYRTPAKVVRVDSSSAATVLKPELLNNINVSAVRDFVARFHEPADARWYKMQDNSYQVKFEVPGIAYRVAYTSRGNWVYSIQTYYEPQLRRDIRGIVKSVYYDYSIVQVEEIDHTEAVATTYIVHLKDDKGWKIVRVCNGEMDLLETINKR
jgi:hypothetical protein